MTVNVSCESRKISLIAWKNIPSGVTNMRQTSANAGVPFGSLSETATYSRSPAALGDR